MKRSEIDVTTERYSIVLHCTRVQSCAKAFKCIPKALPKRHIVKTLLMDIVYASTRQVAFRFIRLRNNYYMTRVCALCVRLQ